LAKIIINKNESNFKISFNSIENINIKFFRKLKKKIRLDYLKSCSNSISNYLDNLDLISIKSILRAIRWRLKFHERIL